MTNRPANLGRIVVVYAGYPHRGGGVSQHLRQLDAALPRLGYRIEIVSLAQAAPVIRLLPHIVQWIGNAWNPPNGFYARYRVGRRVFTPLVEALLRHADVRGVIFEDIFTTFPVAVPSISVLHALQSHNLHSVGVSASQLDRGRAIEADFLKRAPCSVVTVSEPYRRWIERDLEPYDDAPKKLRVIPLGIDMTPFAWPPKARPGRALEMVFAGYLEPRKNLQLLPELLKALVARASFDCRLTIIGHGPQRQELEERFTAAGVRQLVEFTGRVPHERIPEVLQRFHVMVHPSLAESFAFTLLEGRLCGLWTVCPSDLAVPPEFCDARLQVDPVVWAQHILERAPEVMTPLSRARLDSIRDLRGRYSAARMARAYLDLLGLPAHEYAEALQSI